ncbi:hypothetical protein BBJ28_00013902 [Nothophytophthora sp. Chile5]|nr:hypothetical protein BBJ28_00013902 [Nothophytophthora sp. Chile5]
MAGNKNEEVAALEALRDSSAELVRYLDNINEKLLLMNQQNERASVVFSPGLDHHCTWLNTCIAESNYASFYCLVVSATVQTLLQAVVGILMCTLWYAEVEANVRSGWHKPVVALLWVHNVGCVSLANSFFLLAGFHTYLLCVGTGTYDFILANGADGLCTRLLKCNCLQWGKKSKSKRSHVRDGNVNEAKSAEKAAAAPRSRRGSPPPGAIVVLTPPSPHAVAGRGETHSSAASGEQQDERHASRNPTEMVGRGRGSFVSASKQHMELSIGVNESEGIFEEIDLGPSRQEAPADAAEVATTDL